MTIPAFFKTRFTYSSASCLDAADCLKTVYAVRFFKGCFFFSFLFLEVKNEKEDVKSSMGKTTVQVFHFRKFVHFGAFFSGVEVGVDLKSQKKTDNVLCRVLPLNLIAILFFSKDAYVFKENIFLSIRILSLIPSSFCTAYCMCLKYFQLKLHFIQCI